MINPNYKHAGEVLSKEFLEPFKISSCELSKSTFMPLTRVDALLKGNDKINADIALRLSRFFGNSAKYWLWLQIEFDIETESHSKKDELSKIKTIGKIVAA
ncbi:MAG: HigA family addiction module antitoxin [Chitinophagales bacterium]